MEIEYEEKVKGEIPADKEADAQKPLRKKRQKREWEEAVEIIMPDEESIKNESHLESAKETQKKKKVNKNKMEIEEKVELLKETINKMKRPHGQGHHHNSILSETIQEGIDYTAELEKSKQAIVNLNFQNVIARIDQTVQTRVPDQGSFVSFVELLVDKPHLDLLENFNEQLIEHFQLNTQTSVVTYFGNAQPFKMFTSLRENIESALASDRVAEIKRLQKHSAGDSSNKKEKLVIVCVLGEKAYNMKKTTMCELAKYLKEEYEDREYMETSLAIILPVSNLQRVADIPVFSIELCRPKDMFARFLLNIFKNSSLPILSPELLLCLLTEFDLYSISFGEQVRRVRLAVTDCLFTRSQQSKQHHGEASLKRREASAVITFLEKLYGIAQKFETFSQANIDATHRIIEIVLSRTAKYIMPLSQKEEFLKDIEESCKNVVIYLEEAQKEDNLFSRYIAVLKNIDAELKNDLNKKKQIASGANLSRYDKLKKKQAEKDLDPAALANLKIEKIEEIIREIIQYSLHRNVRPNATTPSQPWLLECKLDQYSKVIRPDFVESLLARFTDAEKQTETNEQLGLMDGMILLSQCTESEKDIDISSALRKYSSYLVESGDKRGDQSMYQASFYNAVCELRYKGILEEKRALKNQFIKHFFAKTSFFSAR